MLRNFITIAWRNLRKNKSFSLINLFGLSVGIAAFILIALYINDEWKYDKFLKEGNQIYQVNMDGNFGGQEMYVSNTPPPTGDALVTDFPGIESYTRVFQPGDVMISYEKNGKAEKYFTETKVLAVDTNFLDFFQFETNQGTAVTALMQPNTIVLTESMALKYFGSINVVGELLSFGATKESFKVSAVLKDIPSQSSMKFDFLVPISTYPVVKRFSWSWVWLNVNTYVKLNEALAGNKNEISKLESQFPAMIKRRAAKAFARIGIPLEEFYKNGGHWDLKLQAYNDVHLFSTGIEHTLLQTGSARNLYIFGVVALFIVLLACVNFMNLSTARSFNRAKETGVRKVMGSSTRNLILQFLTESVLFSMMATLVAALLVALFIPAFNQLASKELVFMDIFSGKIGLLIVGIAIISGLLAGSYPAFYLSSFKPIQVLKGTIAKKGGNYFVRNSLVVFQFTISVALIICTAVVVSQLNYMQGKDLGLDKDNVLIIANSQRLGTQEELFRQQMESTNSIASASISTNIPTTGAFGDRYVPEAGEEDKSLAKDISLFSYMTDEYFLPAMNIELKKGRNFSKSFSDSNSVILNETAARQIGWKEPIGKYLQYPGGDYTRFKVIAVVKDFTVQSFRELVIPFALFHKTSDSYSEPTSFMIVKIKGGQTKSAIATIENKWKAFAPGTPLDYNFLDARINKLYSSEQRMGRVFIVFAILSILVACLGLLGLSAFAAEQRTKEIGIRKVLGASVGGLVKLLSKDFLKLVVIASVIAFPIAWWAMTKWLEDFAYRVTIGWWIFLVAGILALLIALMTVSFQAIKAALMNPVKSLRSE